MASYLVRTSSLDVFGLRKRMLPARPIGVGCVGLACVFVVSGGLAGVDSGLGEAARDREEIAGGNADRCWSPSWSWPEPAEGDRWGAGAGPYAVVCDGSPNQVSADHPLARMADDSIVQALCKRYVLRPGERFFHVPLDGREELLEFLPLVGELPSGNYYCLIAGGISAHAGPDIESPGGFLTIGLGEPCGAAADGGE